MKISLMTSHFEQTGLLDLLTQLDAVQHQSSVEIDLSAVEFVKPIGVAVLLALLKVLKKRDVEVKLLQPAQNNVHEYLTRINFYEQLNISVDYPWPRRDSTGRFIEIANPQNERDGERVANEIVEIMAKNVPDFKQVKNGTQYAFIEIVNNVFHHAQSPIQGILCAQSYPQQQCIEIAVVDYGRGIAKSLEGHYKFNSNEEALYLSIQPRITSRPGYNSGEGLFFTTEIIRTNQGSMVLYSRDGGLFFNGNKMAYQAGSMWPGTIVGLTLRTNHPVVTKDIFDKYAPPERDYDWLFSDDVR